MTSSDSEWLRKQKYEHYGTNGTASVQLRINLNEIYLVLTILGSHNHYRKRVDKGTCDAALTSKSGSQDRKDYRQIPCSIIGVTQL